MTIKQLEAEYKKSIKAIKATRQYARAMKIYKALKAARAKDDVLRVGDRVMIKRQYRTPNWLGNEAAKGTITYINKDPFPITVAHDYGCQSVGWKPIQLDKIRK